jgi:branched-chain amino acid transport system substrate-binding protein
MTVKSLSRRRRAVAAVMALTLVAAACGGDDDDDAGSTTEPAEATTPETDAPAPTTGDTTADTTADTSGEEPAPTTEGGATPTTQASSGPATGEPIKIGYAVGLTGSKAEANEGSLAIAEGWAEDVNSRGGIAGHPVEIVSRDSKGDGAQMQAAVQEMFENEGVVALMINDSAAEGAISEYVSTNNIPVIGVEGYNTTEWAALPQFLSYWLDIPGTIYASPDVAATLDSATFAAVSCAEVAACAQAEAIYQPASEALGMEWAGLVTVAGAAPDYVAECLSLIEKNVDFVILSVVSSVAVRVVQDCLTQGYTGYFGSTAGGFEAYLFEDVPDAKIAGALHAFPWWADDPAAQEYRDFMEQYAPDVDYRSGVHSSTYAGLKLFEKAMEGASGEITSESVFAGYYTLQDETLGGLLPQPFNVVEGEPVAKGVCYWPYEFDTSTSDISLLSIEGDSGNGATGDLATTCVEIPAG